MKFDKDKLKIIHKPNEKISLKVKAIGTEHTVLYSFDEINEILEKNQVVDLVPSKKKSDLVMNFDFSEPEGGRYEIEITGGEGEKTSFSVSQTRGNMPKILSFSLEGNRDVNF